MGMVITRNNSALNMFNMNKSLEKLSSGGINSAADDAAGQAIAKKMCGQIRVLDQSSTNAQEALTLTQSADGALDEIMRILQCLRELSVQASAATMNEDDRTAVQDEINALTSVINRVGNNVLALSAGLFKFTVEAATTGTDDSLTFPIGTNAGKTLTTRLDSIQAAALWVSSAVASSTATVQDLDGNDVTASYKAISEVTDGTSDTKTEYALDLSTAAKAVAAISVIDAATRAVTSERSKLGTLQSHLAHTINTLITSSENLTSAEFRICDVDRAAAFIQAESYTF